MCAKLDQHIKEELASLAEQCGVERVILFGSRARGDCRERSDIDLAVQGGSTAEFTLRVDEEVQTLLMFDVVDLGKPVQPELLAEIQKDGVLLYEKI